MELIGFFWGGKEDGEGEEGLVDGGGKGELGGFFEVGEVEVGDVDAARIVFGEGGEEEEDFLVDEMIGALGGELTAALFEGEDGGLEELDLGGESAKGTFEGGGEALEEAVEGAVEVEAKGGGWRGRG